ncbi:hypothetical protein [Flavobacterium sp. SORGH_AS_0622]|jgi:hypothetical protein|uniref:hypothetical protein n=1 Tax=Flavobacterium sp. SORGH_AS_0622 TaxID=3041772 RepID=UPI0027879AF6|nr:hypothetical protein [Flavobacterium sp. SORGH_AS_0622]MDQ1164405.1 hypothetical protein [Flavobacterium sp. SORGH_AS_0622]
MKTKNEKKETKKFGLEKFEVAKLKNLHLISGGNDEKDPPIDDTKSKNPASAGGQCK